jgi:hypothetical protein
LLALRNRKRAKLLTIAALRSRKKARALAIASMRIRRRMRLLKKMAIGAKLRSVA